MSTSLICFSYCLIGTLGSFCVPLTYLDIFLPQIYMFCHLTYIFICLILFNIFSGESLAGGRKRRLDLDESPDSADRFVQILKTE